MLIMVMVLSMVSLGRDFEYGGDLHRESRIEAEASKEKNGRNAYDLWDQMKERESQMKEECIEMHSVRGSQR